jgi:pimeloyl-ACP methyl ester carboxylesterase
MRRLRIFIALLIVTALAASAPVRATAAEWAPTRFTVETAGSGPDVILIPGLTASREVWRSTVAAIPGYRYHLVQVAGFSGLPARGNARGPIMAPLAEELARYIAERHLDRPIVIGHSMGGTLGMMIAARHPDRVGRLMVVDMLPEPAGLFGSTAAGLGGLADLLTALTGADGSRRLVESAMQFFAPDPAAAKRSDPAVVERAANELARIDLTPELGAIAAPTTVIYASLDRSQDRLADQRYRLAYAGLRSVRLQRIGPSGHMIMVDQPTAFTTAVRRFLAAGGQAGGSKVSRASGSRPG